MPINITEKHINVKTGAPAIRDFTMGADPELILTEGKAALKGNAILKEGDEFGIDGNNTCFEIRPDPSTNPLEITNTMRGIMVRQCLKNPKFLELDWFAGGFQREYSIGGHVHFGIKENIIDFARASNILSQYLGAATILIEDREQGLKRRQYQNGKYGHIEDFRPQPYGFEYRAPSSWLTAPYVAAAVMCLSKTVMFEVLNNDKFVPPTRVKASHFKDMDVQSLRALWPDIWREITKMALYNQYKPYLDLLYYMIQKRQSWFPRVSLKEAWGIVDLTATHNSKLKVEAIWHKFAQKNEGGGFVAKKF